MAQRCVARNSDNQIVEVPMAGRYKVTLFTLNHDEEFRHQINAHGPVWVGADTADARVVDEGPAVSNKTPWEGELCVHELAWLENGVAGTDWPKNYLFSWEKLG